jgi:DNA invertase Pin-like site-specific DNA recombinase
MAYHNDFFLVHWDMKVFKGQIRVALYARVSTKDKGQDHENQLAELRQFVAHKLADGWQPAGEYVDHASGKTSGDTQKRPMRDS